VVRYHRWWLRHGYGLHAGIRFTDKEYLGRRFVRSLDYGTVSVTEESKKDTAHKDKGKVSGLAVTGGAPEMRACSKDIAKHVVSSHCIREDVLVMRHAE